MILKFIFVELLILLNCSSKDQSSEIPKEIRFSEFKILFLPTRYPPSLFLPTLINLKLTYTKESAQNDDREKTITFSEGCGGVPGVDTSSARGGRPHQNFFIFMVFIVFYMVYMFFIWLVFVWYMFAYDFCYCFCLYILGKKMA